MTLLKDLLSIVEAKMTFTPEQIAQGIKDLAANFMYKADKFMPDIMEWEEDIADTHGKSPPIEIFKDEAEHYFDDFYPSLAEGDRKLNKALVADHYADLIMAIGEALQHNFSLREE